MKQLHPNDTTPVTAKAWETAAAYAVRMCDDPDCGIHIIGERVDGSFICEIVINREQAVSLSNYLKDKGLDHERRGED